MAVLRIEHQVTDFDAWKAAFDADPLDRVGRGVRRYRILRRADDPNHVMVDLDFDTVGEAEGLLAALRALWGQVDVMHDPSGLVVEEVESVEL